MDIRNYDIELKHRRIPINNALESGSKFILSKNALIEDIVINSFKDNPLALRKYSMI